MQTMQLLEGQLAWLVYIIGAIVGGRFVSSSAEVFLPFLISDLVFRCVSMWMCTYSMYIHQSTATDLLFM